MRKILVVFVLVLVSGLFWSFLTHPVQESKFKMLVFEGSDWCANCLRFEKEVLKTPEFIQFLEEQNIELERIDFPQRTKQPKEVQKYNAAIAETYNFDGTFPTILLVHKQNEMHRTLRYAQKGASAFMDQLQQKMSAFP